MDIDSVNTLGEASNCVHTLAKAIAGSQSANTLLTLVCVASLAVLESSLVLKTFMIGVALVIIYSISVISLKGRDSTHDSDIQKSLPVVSDKPEQSLPHTRAKDSVECELNAAAAAMAEARPHATSVQEHVTNDEQKTQTKDVSTAAIAAPVPVAARRFGGRCRILDMVSTWPSSGHEDIAE